MGQLPARTLTLLARRLQDVKATESAVRLLRRAWERRPNDFWINHNLGWALQQLSPPDWTEAVRYYTAAVVLRPESPGIRLNLGLSPLVPPPPTNGGSGLSSFVTSSVPVSCVVS